MEDGKHAVELVEALTSVVNTQRMGPRGIDAAEQDSSHLCRRCEEHQPAHSPRLHAPAVSLAPSPRGASRDCGCALIRGQSELDSICSFWSNTDS